MWSHRSCLIGALLVSLPSSVMVGQDRPLFSTGSDLVVVHATIKDRGGRYITGLTRALQHLRVGDELRVSTVHGDFRYQVRETMVVGPDDVWVLDPD